MVSYWAAFTIGRLTFAQADRDARQRPSGRFLALMPTRGKTMRWKYDFNASGCWIVDEEGFTVVGHMPITVEQVKVLVHEHNKHFFGDDEPPPKGHEIFTITDAGNRRSIWVGEGMANILFEYGLTFLESGDSQWMPNPSADQLQTTADPLAFIEGVIWANDH